jgi:hypothetical protein
MRIDVQYQKGYLKYKGVSLTINVPLVYMARYLMVLRRATSIARGIRRVGPWKSRLFLGPEMTTTSEASVIWAQKIFGQLTQITSHSTSTGFFH